MFIEMHWGRSNWMILFYDQNCFFPILCTQSLGQFLFSNETIPGVRFIGLWFQNWFQSISLFIFLKIRGWSFLFLVCLRPERLNKICDEIVRYPKMDRSQKREFVLETKTRGKKPNIIIILMFIFLWWCPLIFTIVLLQTWGYHYADSCGVSFTP